MQDRPILVIDNDASAVKLIAETLQPLGYPIVTAASGDEGLGMAKTHSPSLIFINLAVPGTEGLKICKSFMSIIDAPLVLLTMREGKYDPRYKSQYGIVDFLKKPVDAQELVAKIGEFSLHQTKVDVVEAAEAEEVDAIEISEDEAPSASELAASVASYAEDEEPFTPAEEASETAGFVEAAPEMDVAEAAEIIEAVPDEDVLEAGEIETVDEAIEDEEGKVGEWAIPEEEAPDFEEAPSFEEAPAFEKVPAFEEAPAFKESPAFEEAPAFEDTSSAEAAPAAQEMAWGDLGEESSAEEPFEEHGMPEDTAPQGEEPSDEGGQKDQLPEGEPFAPDSEESYELPSMDEKEYEVRPAALERAKRRKSKSRILVPIIALLVVSAAAAAFFFFFPDKDILAPVRDIFISEKDKAVKPAPEKPAPTVARKAEPTPAPKKRPPAPARKPVTPPPTPAAKKPATTAPTAGKTYYVQFGAFRSKGNAVNFQKELKVSGYYTFIKELTSKGEPLYLVLLSDKFSDKWNAFKQARQIKETSDIGTAVHME
jgi:DNA-binding response OmpR family regulator/flagellar basal body-associated protein FliL